MVQQFMEADIVSLALQDPLICMLSDVAATPLHVLLTPVKSLLCFKISLMCISVNTALKRKSALHYLGNYLPPPNIPSLLIWPSGAPPLFMMRRHTTKTLPYPDVGGRAPSSVHCSTDTFKPGRASGFLISPGAVTYLQPKSGTQDSPHWETHATCIDKHGRDMGLPGACSTL